MVDFQPLIGKYRILATLGRGGMADVYLAVAQGVGGFNKLLVVKELRPELAQESEFLAMFLDEARLAARLNHPNVVQTNEVGQDGDRLFIAMEYLDGQPLSRIPARFQKDGGLPVEVMVRIQASVLEGLHYAHELRDFDGTPLHVVHRDATPHNVFFTYDGQVKVVDFGIAKAMDSSTETRTGVLKGKAGYMPPEQAMGEPVDRRADVYAVGVMLWEAASGLRMYKGLSDVAIIARLIKGDLPRLSDVKPDVDPGLAAIVDRALSRAREDRFATAAEMQDALEEWLRGRPSMMSLRAAGEMVAERFQAERDRIRGVIDAQIRQIRRESQLDGEIGARSTANVDLGATMAGGSRPPMVAPDVEGTGSMEAPGQGAFTATGSFGLGGPSSRPTGSYGLGTGLPDLSVPSSGSVPSPASGSGSQTGVPAYSMQPGASSSGDFLAPGSQYPPVSNPPPAPRWPLLTAVGVLSVALAVSLTWMVARSGATPSGDAGGQGVTSAASPSVARRARSAVAGAGGCDSPNKPLVTLSGDIESDEVLSCDKDYLLQYRAFVKPGVTLTIQKGTTIKGDPATKGTLVVQPGGRLIAVGTADEPVVFTSAHEPSKRRAGDWGGVILLGNARINLQGEKKSDKPTRGRVEGIPTGGEYGGADDDDNSGTLKYVRIEYSGTKLGPNNEVNGLTLAGVGRKTVLDYVQVRHTADDCFEFFGGTVSGKHLICQYNGDDGFDWDLGYRGKLQFLILQQSPSKGGDAHGVEGDNDPNGSTLAPRSEPTIYNATLCGKNRSMPRVQYGLLLRRGTKGTIANTIVTGFEVGLDLRDPQTDVTVSNSIFFGNLTANLAEKEGGRDDDDGGFDELEAFGGATGSNSQTSVDIDCFHPTKPRFGPPKPLLAGAATPPDDGFFDTSARYVGAVRDGKDDWPTRPWTAWSDH